MRFSYYCVKCGWKADETHRSMLCARCKGDMKTDDIPSVIGTETSFGIRKAFKDWDTGKTIDTWKKWEQAGYRDATKSPNMSPEVQARVKEKIDKVNRSKGKTMSLPVAG